MDDYYDIHNNKNSWITGYFNLDGVGEVAVVWYENDLLIPHFHIENENKSFDCTVFMFKPMYFDHGRKNFILTDIQKKQLDTFLRSKEESKFVKCSIWKFMVSTYEHGYRMYNRTDKYYKTDTQPDYTKMVNIE